MQWESAMNNSDYLIYKIILIGLVVLGIALMVAARR
jgi:hypothetical protein